jgi:hypothetical protein
MDASQRPTVADRDRRSTQSNCRCYQQARSCGQRSEGCHEQRQHYREGPFNGPARRRHDAFMVIDTRHDSTRRKASRGNAFQGGGVGVPNTPASGSPHTEDWTHPIPRGIAWRVTLVRVKSGKVQTEQMLSSRSNAFMSTRPSHLERRFVTLYDGANLYRGERLWRMQV